MGMDFTPISAILDFGGKVLDKFVADPAAKDAAKLAMAQAVQAGNLEEMRVALSAIISDSNSTDPWTSRARPSFLYVVYVLILFGLPIGILSAFKPDMAGAIANGFGLWLKAIPDSFITLFGVVMTGYGVQRTYEKVKGVAQ